MFVTKDLAAYPYRTDIATRPGVVALKFGGPMSVFRKVADANAERELTEAVRRVHDRYGANLQSFFREVQEEKAKNSQEAKSTRIDDDSAT